MIIFRGASPRRQRFPYLIPVEALARQDSGATETFDDAEAAGGCGARLSGPAMQAPLPFAPRGPPLTRRPHGVESRA